MQNPNSFEQDRTLGRTYVEYGERKSRLYPENETRNLGRLCPMCEAVFPLKLENNLQAPPHKNQLNHQVAYPLI